MSRFLFRCDVSPTTGLGHLRRCLTLANELKESGAFVYFACRSIDYNWKKDVHDVADNWTTLEWSLTPEGDAQEVIRLSQQQKVDTVIIDHYRADEEYQMLLYRAGIHWLQFDWACSGPMWADWVLNTNPAARKGSYLSLRQRDETRFLLGPTFALLRQEFRRWQPMIKFREHVQKILLTFGGGDDRGSTVFCLEAMKLIVPAIERIVLVSSANPNLSNIFDWVGREGSPNVSLLVDEQEIARTMCDTDLAISGGGTTTFETAAMGLPSLIFQITDNQANNAIAWEQAGVALDLGHFHKTESGVLKHKISELIEDCKLRKSMAHTGRSLVDCYGTQRVANALLSGR